MLQSPLVGIKIRCLYAGSASTALQGSGCEQQHRGPEPKLCCRPMKNTVSGNETRGFMKIIVDAESERVVGMHMIGPDCAEIMQVSLLAHSLVFCHITHIRLVPPLQLPRTW